MAIRSYIKDGKKYFEAYVNGFNSRGVRIQRKRKGIETLRRAEQIEFELKNELLKLKGESADVRWSEWVKEALQTMKMVFKPSTLYTYEKTLTKWVNGVWNDRYVNTILKMDVHNLIFEGMSPEATMHTRQYVLKIVKRIFQMAMDQGLIDRNPCQGLSVKVPETEKTVLSADEVKTLLQEAKAVKHRFYPIWVMALFTGMRSGELYALRWTDIDLDSNLIHVRRSWSSKNGYSSTKNQKWRIVPISGELNQFLKGYRFERTNEEYILPHLQEWSDGEAALVLKQYCKMLKITQIRFHDLRATFITNLLANGESLARVMAIVGHADMETTNVYLRKAGIELRDGTRRLGYTVPADNMADVIPFSIPGKKDKNDE